MAELAHVSFRSVQLIEAGGHDPQISSLEKIARALGYPSGIIENCIQKIFQLPVDSAALASERLVLEGEEHWKIALFEFVDAFRTVQEKHSYIETPLAPGLSFKMKALFASTVETLCYDANLPAPEWCQGIEGLPEPWFVSGVENLKAMALVESSVHFRKRNIFVLENFLERR